MSTRLGPRLSLGFALLVVVALAAFAVRAESSSSRPLLQGPLKGVVSTTSIGPLAFGASRAQVRAWAGNPEFTSPPVAGYPVPRHDKGTVVLGYHCKGISVPGRRGRATCHTLFGFRDNELTAFQTDASDFALASGVRPGMTVAEAMKREPKATLATRCSRLLLPSAKGSSRAVYIAAWKQPRVFSIYASSGNAAFDAYC